MNIETLVQRKRRKEEERASFLYPRFLHRLRNNYASPRGFIGGDIWTDVRGSPLPWRLINASHDRSGRQSSVSYVLTRGSGRPPVTYSVARFQVTPPRIEEITWRAYYVLSLYPPYPCLFGTRVVKFHVVQRYGDRCLATVQSSPNNSLLPFRPTYFKQSLNKVK